MTHKTHHPILLCLSLLLGLSAALALAAGGDPAYSQSPGPVVISEIAWMGTTVSANDEWIELYNNSASPLPLTGWSLAAGDGTPSISLAGAIPANGHYLLERTDDTTAPPAADLIYTGALGDAGEDLILRDAASNIVDRVNASSAWFAGHAAARVPMLRVDALLDGSQANNWTYSFPCATPTNTAGDTVSCISTINALPYPLDYSVYFNQRATTATDITLDHTPMEDALLGLIDGASSTIDVALYGLDRQSVIDALIVVPAEEPSPTPLPADTPAPVEPTATPEPAQPVQPPPQADGASPVIVEVNDKEECVDIQNMGADLWT